MEINEGALEANVKKLRSLIETKLAGLNPTEIAAMSNKIPEFHTMLEYRTLRENFFHKFDKPLPIPTAVSYSEELLHLPNIEYDLPSDIQTSLNQFFKDEIKRVQHLRTVATERCVSYKGEDDFHLEFVNFIENCTNYIYKCEEGLARLEASTLITFNADDLFLELNSKFMKTRKKAMLKSYYSTIRRFPITHRKSIFKRAFTTIEKLLREEKTFCIPVLVKDNAELDRELTRLAKRFGLSQDFESSDGQQFLYYANSTFESFMANLKVFDLKKKNIKIPAYNIDFDQDNDIQDALISQISQDFKYSVLFDQLNEEEYEISTNIKDAASFYNVVIGNQISGQLLTYEMRKRLLPVHKISAWMELRYIHSKFLASAILSYLNYFEYIKYQIKNPKSKEYRVTNDPHFKEIIHISDDNGPFLFQSAFNQYEDLKNKWISIGSYYLNHFERMENKRLADRDSIMEQVLEYEFRWMNAKRNVVQIFLEILEHTHCRRVINNIIRVINKRPHLNLSQYKQLDSTYELAISIMEKEGKVLRHLLSIQVEHERHIGSQLSKHVPLFDKPIMLPKGKYHSKLFNESMLISPFEIYPTLKFIAKFSELIPAIARELSESADIKFNRFREFMEHSVWEEVEMFISNSIEKGYFPYDRASFPFSFLLSDSVNSLFTSPYVNSIEAIESLIVNMNEGRRLRFMMAARRFVYMTYKLQALILDTNLLQTTYFEQCDILGIAERGVLMGHFKEMVKKDNLDIHSTNANDKIIEFALTEYEPLTINFASQSCVKDIIFSINFTVLKRLIQFQYLQNVILEITCRFNIQIIDSDFFVEYFEYLPKKRKIITEDSNTVFMTAADTENNEETEEKDSKDDTAFMKQFIAAKLFYQSTSIFRDNQIAHEEKSDFLLCIKTFKAKARTALLGQIKQNGELIDEEIVQMYKDEMLYTFSAFLYKIEIAHIATLERQILLSNAFVDTYILGPDPTCNLVNEAGRFEKFFYVPTWVDTYRMMLTAPIQRQGVALKPVLHFIMIRYRVLSLVRYESSLQLHSKQAFTGLYEQTFQIETPVFQKLFNEFGRLPNARDVDVAAAYFRDKELFFNMRFEYTILAAFESFFVSLNLESKSSNANPDKLDLKTKVLGITDSHFGDIMKDIWFRLHKDLPKIKGVMNLRRYVPPWHEQFLSQCNENDRNEMLNQFISTDSYFEDAFATMRNTSFMDTFQLLPSALEFIKNAISQFHLKFALFLLNSHVNEKDISLTSTVINMTMKIYIEGAPTWNDIIVPKASDRLLPKEERQHGVIEHIPEPKLIQAVFEIVQTHLDLILMSNQIKELATMANQFAAAISGLNESSANALRPEFNDSSAMFSQGEINLQKFVIKPHIANEQFNEEVRYARAKIVNFVYNSLDSCALERRNHDGTFSTLYDGEGFEENCYKLSEMLKVFTHGSLNDVSLTWGMYIDAVASERFKNMEILYLCRLIGSIVKERFLAHTDYEKSLKFNDQILELNNLRDAYHKLMQGRYAVCDKIEHVIRKEFEDLENDLHEAIVQKKSQFKVINQQVYEKVGNKIENANGVKLEVDPNISSSAAKIVSHNDQLFEQIKQENESMKKKILLMRIFRCLSEIATTHFYKKRLLAVEADRKQANMVLWSNRLQYESQEATTEKELVKTHIKLTDTEIEIERLKSQLENEKMSNIQLVHWKAKNLTSIDNIKKQLSEFKGVGDVNIDELTGNLRLKQQKVEALRREAQSLEDECENEIRKPMKEIENLRKQVMKTKMEKSQIIENAGGIDVYVDKDDENIALLYEQVSDENAQLRVNNDMMQTQINEYLETKHKKARDVKKFMETTVQAPPALRSSVRQVGTIIRPICLKPANKV